MTHAPALWKQLFAAKLDLQAVSGRAFDSHIASFGDAAQPPRAGVREAFGDELAPLAKDAAGGVYARWTHGKERPIVYFGTEGNTCVIARSEDEWLGMLAHRDDDTGDYGLHDLMQFWHDELVALDVDRPAADHRVRSGRLAAVDPTVAAQVSAAGVVLVADVPAAVEAANRAHLWPLLDRLDTIVSGHPARRLWRAAWNAPEPAARAFSPKETYVVGERVTYTWKYSWGEGQGRAVVLAHPQPRRVLLADQANVFVRACA